MLVELTFIVNRGFSLAEIASSLLHEGVHARVNAAGVFRTPATLPKEERPETVVLPAPQADDELRTRRKAVKDAKKADSRARREQQARAKNRV